MTSAVTRSTQAFYFTHTAVRVSMTTGVVIVAALVLAAVLREVLRVNANTVRRRLWVFTVVTAPLEVVFAVTVILRFRGLA